ncbi:MAG TPA: hypothetical protein VEG36_10125 [Burkholderiales bacterium]|nr:hypothetical protein [Burkholderiales bacterium]
MSEDEPEKKGLSPTQLAIAALGAAIVLVVVMILMTLSGLL